MFNRSSFAKTVGSNAKYNEGLKAYMNTVYKYMAMALGLTGVVSYIVASSPFLLRAIFGSPLYIVVLLAPLFFVMYFTAKIWSISPEKARNYLWIYSGLLGLSLSSIFLVYTGTSIVRTFFITSATFGGMSLYGYTTKKDLSEMGSFMMMGLIGLVIASLVNIFFKSPGMEFIISIVGVIVFVGLTAYDVQKIRKNYDYVGVNSDLREKVAIIAALNLYMDFINLFLFLLRFMGNRRR
jgi:FtsH-binding integral membrane protein